MDSSWHSATRLGKIPHLGDPAYVRNERIEKQAETVQDKSIKDDVPMVARLMCIRRGYGIHSVWPPFDPGRPHKEFKEEMNRSGQLVGEYWRMLNRIILHNELDVQTTILELVEGDMKDAQGDRLTLEGLLEKSWGKTRDFYNEELAIIPHGLESDFSLDPEGKMTTHNSVDLDTFALDYLTQDMCKDSLFGHDHCFPLYRHGGNYNETREAFKDAVEDSALFKNLSKPNRIKTSTVQYNDGVAEILQKQRASCLAPHINMEDLTNPYYLFKFLHTRGRFYPYSFIRRDNDRMYMGKTTHILCGACDPNCFILFDDFAPLDKDSLAGFKPEIVFKERLELLKNSEAEGLLLGSMEAWLVMQSQIITCLFLTTFCREILVLANKVEPKDTKEALQRTQKVMSIGTTARYTIKSMAKQQYATWKDFNSSRQYEVDPMYCRSQIYHNILHTKKLDAEEHIRRLFDEPDYFVHHIMEQKEHHWINLRYGYDEKDPGYDIVNYETSTAARHDLYIDCMKNVLRRAFFEFFIWNTIDEAMKGIYDHQAETGRSGAANFEFIDGGEILMPHRGEQDRAPVTNYTRRSRSTQLLIRQAAAFFVYEFRKRAIHVSSQTTRHVYCITNMGDTNRTELKKNNEYYDSPDIKLGLRHQALDSERSQLPRMVAEMTENFISNKSSSAYVGMRKTAARIQRHIEDCDDAMKDKFSDMFRNTLEGLNILADIGEELYLSDPSEFNYLEWPEPGWEHYHRKLYSDILEMFSSYDILALGSCSVHNVPSKRTDRIFRFLDEMQGMGKAPEKSFGKAKTDIKRFGASFLKTVIVPLNKSELGFRYQYRKWGNLDPSGVEKPVFQASDAVLNRLRFHMGMTEEEWIYHDKEEPEDFQINDSKDERQATRQIWMDLRTLLTKRHKDYKKKGWKQRADANKPALDNQFDFVSNELMRYNALDSIRKHRQEKAQESKKEKLARRERRWRQLNPEPDDTKMGGAFSQLTITKAPSPERNTGNDNDEEPAPPTDNEPQPQPQPPPQLQIVPQQPVAPAQPPQQSLPAQPQTTLLAPDGGPKGIINKHCWEAWRRILVGDIRYTSRAGQSSKEKLPDVRWQTVEDAIKAIDFKYVPGGGSSHHRFVHTEGCRWPEEVVSAFSIAYPHGTTGGNKSVPSFKIKNWRHYLGQRGLTFDVLKAWYRQK
ncbi:hypothetical protein FGRMN_5999 [Fusarium graminum]|nr:hypothetical protein FGRMN_5999 [Fusarium graminum]